MTDEEVLALAEAEMSKAASMSSDAGSVTRRSASDIESLYRLRKRIAASANTGGLFGLRGKRLIPGSPAE